MHLALSSEQRLSVNFCELVAADEPPNATYAA